jgi:endonuclease G, mitochondrial
MPAKRKSSPTFSLLLLVLFIALLLFFAYRKQRHTESSTPTDSPAATGDDSQLLLGNPTQAVQDAANRDNYLIDQQYYIESYNNSKGGPNWVSWHIGIEDMGQIKRQDNFRPDEKLPNGFFAADDADYRNTGFDKGHNCPSADRTASEMANASTFLMDNIIPQAPNNNQNVWEHLESYCRAQVKRGNEAYVVMGNYGSGGTGKKGYKSSIAGGKINVPAHVWKVVVLLPNGNNDLARINNDTRVIAIDTPNDNNVTSNWMDYLTTIDEIERRCGCDLLSALPTAVQQEIEGKKFKGGN